MCVCVASNAEFSLHTYGTHGSNGRHVEFNGWCCPYLSRISFSIWICYFRCRLSVHSNFLLPFCRSLLSVSVSDAGGNSPMPHWWTTASSSTWFIHRTCARRVTTACSDSLIKHRLSDNRPMSSLGAHPQPPATKPQCTCLPGQIIVLIMTTESTRLHGSLADTIQNSGMFSHKQFAHRRICGATLVTRATQKWLISQLNGVFPAAHQHCDRPTHNCLFVYAAHSF